MFFIFILEEFLAELSYCWTSIHTIAVFTWIKVMESTPDQNKNASCKHAIQNFLI